MADIIQLLPDHVANQIAAGEVIQRPASVVKELMENAVDAGADQIHLIVKDSGRALIQIIDNGCGMSPADARLAFERHATSKINSAEDLFRIRTKGFRGEALASIASVAQVELKTRQTDAELGTHVIIEGSDVKEASPCQTAAGTSFAVKNLFFNVPARRQFLKSDQVEFKHILDEFQRVALAHPAIAMVMHHNSTEVYHLLKGNFRQRIVGLFGQKFDERLVPIEEETDVVGITGFVGKPEFAKKGRGDQYFFVNGRFIKHPYLHHAVSGAFDGLLPEGKYPVYFINLDIDPSRIDVNIHPTKTEVKFREERAIYSILKSTVRRGLGKFQVAPTLDFEQESSFNIAPFDKNRPVIHPDVNVNTDYNPFATDARQSSGLAGRMSRGDRLPPRGSDNWRDFYEVLKPEPVHSGQTAVHVEPEEQHNDDRTRPPIFQIGQSYIVTSIRSGMLCVDQQRAHERVLFEQFMQAEGQLKGGQTLLFPETRSLSAADHNVLTSALDALQTIGFDVENLGGRDVVIHALPAELADRDPSELLDSVIHALQDSEFASGAEDHFRQKVAVGLAKSGAVKRGKAMSETEMRDLVDRLFRCETPTYSPTGKAAIVTFTPEELAVKFR